jgi:hypothetical protein
MQLESHSVHAFPSTHVKAANPSSHVAMVPSLLSSSLSRARSYSCNSMATADTTTTLKERESYTNQQAKINTMTRNKPR